MHGSYRWDHFVFESLNSVCGGVGGAPVRDSIGLEDLDDGSGHNRLADLSQTAPAQSVCPALSPDPSVVPQNLYPEEEGRGIPTSQHERKLS